MSGWRWDVDPETRSPLVDPDDLAQIQNLVDQGGPLIFHNAKFDIRALTRAGITWGQDHWDRIEDTLIGSHVLASSDSHGLKDLAVRHLGIPTDDQEGLRSAVNDARRWARTKFPSWRIAAPEDPHFPALRRSPRSGWWVMDMWLPRAVAQADPESPREWMDVLDTYALGDAERTMSLWALEKVALAQEGLVPIYHTRRDLLRITYQMEERGISLDPKRLQEITDHYQVEAVQAATRALNLADGTVDNLRSPKQLQGVLYGSFGFIPEKETKTGWATDADTLDLLKGQKRKVHKGVRFIENLLKTRKFSKAVDYLTSYRLSAMKSDQGGLVLRPSFNVTGTATTRFSSHDPNAQNISKKEGMNLRQVFGPDPGREWWSFDYSNVELRIFAFASGDRRLIKAFESGQSVHLVIAEELHPQEFRRLGPEKFSKTDRYRWTKNGNFSLIYGASERKADATYRVPGAYQKIRSRFPLIDRFMESHYQDARKNGFVTTLGGYRLQIPPDGPHKAVNYFVQGSAGWAMVKAMIRVADYLEDQEDHHLIMTIHDELDMDFPRKTPLRIPRKVKRLMEKSGEDIGVPTPVDADLIRTNWAEGEGRTL